MTQQWQAQKWDSYEVNVWSVCVLTEFTLFHSNMKYEDFFISYSQLMKHHQAITVQVLWHVTIQPLDGERPFYPNLGNLLDLDCEIPDAGSVSRVSRTPHPYPYTPSLLRHIPPLHTFEGRLRGWPYKLMSLVCLTDFSSAQRGGFDDPLCRTWAIYWGQLLWSTAELQILQQGCNGQKGSWGHTKRSTREGIP